MYALTVRPEDGTVTGSRFLEPEETLLPEETEVQHGFYILALRALVVGTPVAYLEETVQYISPPSAYHVWNASTFAYEVSADLLEAARQAKWEEIKDYRENVRNSGGFLVAGLYWFHSDTPSRFDQLGLVNAMILSVLPATSWSLMDGTEVALTAPIVQGVFGGHMTLRGTNFQVSKAHKTALWLDPDPANYNYLGGGWVPIFGE